MKKAARAGGGSERSSGIGYMPWTKEEEDQLLDEFSQEIAVSEIAKLHNRSRGGILARLKRLGVID